MVGMNDGGGGGVRVPGLADETNPTGTGGRAVEVDYVRCFHRHEPSENQCSSAVFMHIKAPVHLVRSLCLSCTWSWMRWSMDFLTNFIFDT